MGSLAELPDLKGFFSYSRGDDEHSQGSLSRLRAQIYNELRLQLGRDFKLWQDTEAIPDGAEWEDEIKRAISGSVFFIPIVTPRSLASIHCRFEFQAFLDREEELGRKNLVFPLLYIRVPALEEEALWRPDPLLGTIGRRQYIDWQKYRHRSFAEAGVAEKIEQYCRNIVESLQQPWVSAAERRAAEDREAHRIAEQARRDREEQQRQLEEQRRKEQEQKEQRQKDEVEQELRRAKKAEAQRLAYQRAEEERQRRSREVENFGKDGCEAPQQTGVQPRQSGRVRLRWVLLSGAGLIFVLGLSYFILEYASVHEPSASTAASSSSPSAISSICTYYRLQNNLDPKRVAILTDEEAAGQIGIQLRQTVQQRGLTITDQMFYPPSTKDFAPYVSRAAATANTIAHCGPSSYAFDNFAKGRGIIRQP
jgi:flagellar motor protein MotB